MRRFLRPSGALLVLIALALNLSLIPEFLKFFIENWVVIVASAFCFYGGYFLVALSKD